MRRPICAHSPRLDYLVSIVLGVALALSIMSCGQGSSVRAARTARNEIGLKRVRREQAFAGCMGEHGIVQSRGEPISSLWIRGGVTVPKNTTLRDFRIALAQCRAGPVQVAGMPVTGAVLRSEITLFATCLRDESFAVRGPDFSGHGPTLRIAQRPKRGQEQVSQAENSCVSRVVSEVRSVYRRRRHGSHVRGEKSTIEVEN